MNLSLDVRKDNARHAAQARRAIAQSLAAKAAGEMDLARMYAQLAAEHLDRHLAQVRARLP